MNPLVSVVIPTYKRSETLLNAIDSVLEQSYTRVEIIVVDDNNPDTEFRRCTESRMRHYLGNERVLYVKHPYNKNGAAARNTGLKACSGKYVCFLDDDDVFFKEKCAKQVAFLEANPCYSACCCDYKKDGAMVCLSSKENYIEDILLLKKTPQTSGIMFCKSFVDVIGGFDESYIRHQDYEFLLRFFANGGIIHKLDEVLYERKTSGIENTPKGKAFCEVKKKFLSDFDGLISEIALKKRGFKRRVYSANYKQLAKNFFKERCYFMSLVFSIKSFVFNPILFVQSFFSDVVIFIKRKIAYD